MILIKILLVLLILLILFFMSRKQIERYRHKELRKLALSVIPKLNEHKINYWVDYGTLLGIIREGDIIKHDEDVDICLIPDENLGKKLQTIVDEIKENKYYLEYHTWGAYRIRKNILVYADLYIMELKDNHYVDISGKLPLDLAGNFTYIDWKGISVRVPEKIHETLVWRYGKDYMTPVRSKRNENFSLILIV